MKRNLVDLFLQRLQDILDILKRFSELSQRLQDVEQILIDNRL